jgi:hypothetical protein
MNNYFSYKASEQTAVEFAMIPFKIRYKENRRLSAESSISFHEISNLILSIFPSLRPRQFSLSWIDEEGDKITVSSDIELACAIQCQYLQKVVVLDVLEKFESLPQEITNKPLKFKCPPIFHSNVICDSCGQTPIVGIRYKCLLRDDYDLCQNCEKNQSDRYSSLVLKITSPTQWNNYSQFQIAENKNLLQSSLMKPAEQCLSWRQKSCTNVFSPPKIKSSISSPTKYHTQIWSKRSMKPCLKFIKDLSIPDGTKLLPNTLFQKKWLVRNDGNDCWPRGCNLHPAGGDWMLIHNPLPQGEEEAVKEANHLHRMNVFPLPTIGVNEDYEIALQLKSPSKLGLYTAYFRAKTNEGQWFGHRIWVSILVVDNL